MESKNKENNCYTVHVLSFRFKELCLEREKLVDRASHWLPWDP